MGEFLLYSTSPFTIIRGMVLHVARLETLFASLEILNTRTI